MIPMDSDWQAERKQPQRKRPRECDLELQALLTKVSSMETLLQKIALREVATGLPYFTKKTKHAEFKKIGLVICTSLKAYNGDIVDLE